MGAINLQQSTTEGMGRPESWAENRTRLINIFNLQKTARNGQQGLIWLKRHTFGNPSEGQLIPGKAALTAECHFLATYPAAANWTAKRLRAHLALKPPRILSNFVWLARRSSVHQDL